MKADNKQFLAIIVYVSLMAALPIAFGGLLLFLGIVVGKDVGDGCVPLEDSSQCLELAQAIFRSGLMFPIIYTLTLVVGVLHFFFSRWLFDQGFSYLISALSFPLTTPTVVYLATDTEAYGVIAFGITMVIFSCLGVSSRQKVLTSASRQRRP